MVALLLQKGAEEISRALTSWSNSELSPRWLEKAVKIILTGQCVPRSRFTLDTPKIRHIHANDFTGKFHDRYRISRRISHL